MEQIQQQLAFLESKLDLANSTLGSIKAIVWAIGAMVFASVVHHW